MLGQILAQVGGKFLERGLDKTVDKVFGVPTPGAKDPAESGDEYRRFLENAFPGSSTSERLGANSPYGSVQSADLQGRNQMRVQQQELRTRERIAENTNIANLLAQTSPMGAAQQKQALQMYASHGLTKAKEMDNRLRQEREQLNKQIQHIDSQIKQLDSSTEGQQIKNKLESERAKLATQLARKEADPTPFKVQSVMDSVSDRARSAGRFVGSRLGSASRRIIDSLRNNDVKPSRFKGSDAPSSAYVYG